MRRLCGLVAALLSTPVWASCPLDPGVGTGWVAFSNHYMVAFRADPLRVETGVPFALVMNVCSKNGQPAELVAVDAWMPEHRHGMNYRTTIVPGQDGRYRVEGLLFHMPGRWEVNFDVRSGEETERLSHDILLN
ncbi:MAG: FixH family protein [Enhydrobacter sp.]|nr:MAG: FixH family protein [Enhydrobacter sp.]